MSINLKTQNTGLETIYMAMTSLCHIMRQDIIGFIRKQGTTPVQKIYRSKKYEQSITSQHLRILRKSGIVTAEKVGKKSYYAVNEEVVQGYLALAKKIATFSSHTISDKYKRKDLLYYRKAQLFLRAAKHPYRQQILDLLEEKGKLVVSEITIRTKTEQSVVSQHLAILRAANLVKSERDGKFICYSRNEVVIETVEKEIALFFEDVKTK